MPYYRILIWTKKRKQPYSGIRWMESHNINMIQGMVEKKAVQLYHSTYIDCEVQMLSKLSTAVRRFVEKQKQ